MAINVSPTEHHPTHHIKLSKGGHEIGLILCDADGNADDRIERNGYPRSALKFYTGEEKHADSEPPFRPIVQDDWSGGRALRDFETDTSRYADGWRTDALHLGRVILGPQETYASGAYRKANTIQPGSVMWRDAHSGFRFYARKFTTPAGGYTFHRMEVLLRKVGAPANALLSVYTNVAGSPGVLVEQGFTILAAAFTDTLAQRISILPLADTVLNAATDYWLVFQAALTDGIPNHWELGVDPNSDADTQHCDDGASWAAIGGGWGALWLRVLDDTVDQRMRLFEYKRALYAYTRPVGGGASQLYLNGDRGAADSNAGLLGTLEDASKAWTAGQWTGCRVLITQGPGAEEDQPWRLITGNDATTLFVAPDWEVTHTTLTEYVILGANSFIHVQTLGAYVTSHAVTDDAVYFAFGETAGVPILRFRQYNLGGWTTSSVPEDEMAVHLKATRDPLKGMILWGSRNNHPRDGVSIFKARVPKANGKLYHDLLELAATDEPWDARVIASVTQGTDDGGTKIDIAPGFTTGIAAVENLPAPVDITRAKALGMLVRSSVATIANDLQLVLADRPDLDLTWLPISVTNFDADATLNRAYDGNAVSEATLAHWHTPTQLNPDWLEVMFSHPFEKITVTMGTTPNVVNPCVLTVKYFNGSAWVAVSDMVDGTIVGATTFGLAAGVSGNITWTLPSDWQKSVAGTVEGYAVRLEISANATVSINVREITVTPTHLTTLNLPALNANQWTWVNLAISPLQYPHPDATQIRSVALKVAVDKGAQVVTLYGGIHALAEEVPFIKLPNSARIRGFHPYAGSRLDQRKIPWIVTESELGKIESDDNSNDLYAPVSLDELATLRSELNGQAMVNSGVYLYFNLDERVERYYDGQLDDVGPTQDEGLPADRRGTVRAMLAYADRVLAVIDAGASGYSSLLAKTTGWHEVYRAHRTGAQMYDAIIQTIPGSVTRLWMSEAADLLWIPLAINPLTEPDYRYTHQGTIITSRISTGLQDILKFWSSLKLGTLNLANSFPDGGQLITADYRIDGATAWTPFPATFDTSFYQEIDFTSDYSAAGRVVEVRLVLHTSDASLTPILYSMVIEALQIFEVKFTWTFRFRLMDRDKDLLGNPDDVPSYKTKLDQLDLWVREATPELMNGLSEIENGRIVRPDDVPVQRIRMITKQDPEGSREGYVCQMTVLEI